MTTQTNTKIRFVRCPKCKLVLPEPDTPILYICGGCGAVLQAKDRKTKAKATGLNHDGGDVNGKGNMDGGVDGPSQEAAIFARGDSLSESGSNRNQDNGLNQETTDPAGGEHLPSTGSIRNQGNCLNEETMSEREESSSDSGSNRNQDNGLTQETTDLAGGVPLLGTDGIRKRDNRLDEETMSEREESLSDSGSSRNHQDNGLAQESTDPARGEPLPGAEGIRKRDNCLDEETMSGRGEPLSGSDSDRNQDIGLNQATPDPTRGEPLPGADSIRKHDNCLDEETISGRGESLSGSDSYKNQDNGLNQEIPDPARGEPLPGAGVRKQDNCLDEETISERGESLSDIGSNSHRDICPNQETTISAGGESPEDLSSKRDENNFHNDSGRQPGAENFSPQRPNSSELALESAENMEQVQSDSNAYQTMKEYENESGDSDRHCLSGRSFSDDFFSSTEFLGRETEDSSSELEPNMAIRETQSTSSYQDRVDKTESENCRREQTEHSNMYLAQHVGNVNESKFEDHGRTIPHVPSSTEIVPVILSPVVDRSTPVNENLRVHNFGSLEKESLKKDESGLHDADENPSSGSILSHNADSPDDQHLVASPRSIPEGFGRDYTCITVTPDNHQPLGNSGSEFGLRHRELSKSPTKCYYGYDGSDGFEGGIAGRFSKHPRRKAKHANFNNSSGLHIEDGPPSNYSRSGNLEMQYKPILGYGLNDMLSKEPEVRQQARKPSILPHRNHPSIRTNHDDLHDPRSFGHREEQVSSLPFFPVYPHSGQRTANSPPYPVNSFQYYSSFGSADVLPSYTEPAKMELLRVVNELKEELKRMHISNSRFPLTVTREEKYTPLYHHDHHIPPVETFSDARYSRYPRRYSQEKSLHQLNHLPPRMAFSGEVADYTRSAADYPCLHCHPQDWRHCHCSTSYNSPRSSSSSPHRYKSSEFSTWDRETMYRDKGIRNMQSRERYQSAKRHVRPVAGGNPIVACYHCSVLLHLPADFLLLGKKCHKLRCNACGKILKFSLNRGKHIAPYIPDAAVAPPPSMVDGSSGYIPQGNWVSASHSNGNGNPDVDPMSYTDDYGVSFERSYSTEGEPSSVLAPPLHPAMAVEDRKMKSVLDDRTTKSLENLGKSSPEIKELAANGGSPLHRLMGYSSPSAVMKN